MELGATSEKRLTSPVSDRVTPKGNMESKSDVDTIRILSTR